MGMTLTEKILARHAGLERVEPGQIINAKVDLVLANELSAAVAIGVMRKIKGATRVFDPSRIALVADHFVPAKDAQSAGLARLMKDFASEQQIEHFFDVGRGGIEHVVLPEEGLVAPGELIVGGDSHTCTYGAFGAFATGMGSTDIAAAFVLGEVWLKTPATIKIVYSGAPGPMVYAKDIMLRTVGELGIDGATYRAIEYHGSTVDHLSITGRITMANMAIRREQRTASFTPMRRRLRTSRNVRIDPSSSNGPTTTPCTSARSRSTSDRWSRRSPVRTRPTTSIRSPTSRAKICRSIKSSSDPAPTATSTICAWSPRFSTARRSLGTSA